MMLPHLSKCNPSLFEAGEVMALSRSRARHRARMDRGVLGKERERAKEVLVELEEVAGEEGEEWSWWSSYLLVGFGFVASILFFLYFVHFDQTHPFSVKKS